jgi:hypothetical protein
MFKKEEKRKHNEARKGLTEEQIAFLDGEDEESKKIEELARKIHAEKFPEEYDFMYDSLPDANDRKRGINPMSAEYVEKIEQKRSDLGVSPLSESGMPTSDDTLKLCLEEATKIIKQSNM